VSALKPPQGTLPDGTSFGQLHVVNGISTTTSSSLTTAARENVPLGSSYADGLPGRTGGSTLRWGALKSHPEIQEVDDQDSNVSIENYQPLPPPRIITPSLATLEKAVAARIYFENLYFPLFRHPSSREQRRDAMEKDMAEMQLTHAQKENLRSRWRQNETEYLRERRQKVDASAFVKLKTIGHGTFSRPVTSMASFLTSSIPTLSRRLWCCVSRKRAIVWKALCHETGMLYSINPTAELM